MAKISKTVRVSINSIDPRIVRYTFTPRSVNLEIEYQGETENVVFDGENVIFDGEQVVSQ